MISNFVFLNVFLTMFLHMKRNRSNLSKHVNFRYGDASIIIYAKTLKRNYHNAYLKVKNN